MRIAVVIPHFGAGGAERVASLLANFWAGQGHNIAAITFDCGGEPFFPLDESIERMPLAAANRPDAGLSRIWVNLVRLLRLRRALRRFAPDATVAFMTEASAVTACAAWRLPTAVVVTERNQPDRPSLGRVHRILRRLSFPLADAIVVQTPDAAAWARKRFPRLPVGILPNPVELQAAHIGDVADRERLPEIIAIGRLVPQKGFDLLIEAFARVTADFPDWRLTIYGEGPERENLQRAVERHGLAGRITLPGLIHDVTARLSTAGLFVLASRYEGYPNALIEALACGCPVLATNCRGAIAEILDGGRFGLLVDPEDAGALADALRSMLSAPDLRAQYRLRAAEAVRDIDIAAVAPRWLDLLASLVARRG